MSAIDGQNVKIVFVTCKSAKQEQQLSILLTNRHGGHNVLTFINYVLKSILFSDVSINQQNNLRRILHHSINFEASFNPLKKVIHFNLLQAKI